MPAVYRVEKCPNNRATCQNTECKKQGVKITQGELRFGSLVEIREHQSWQYKHWGCVTPHNCATWKEISDGDPEMIDGLDDLPQEWQDKIVRAIEQGHVDDEDWKGDLEKNRPGQKGFRSPKKKATKKEDDAEVQSDAEDSPTEAKPSKSRKRKVNDGEDADDEAGDKKDKKVRGRQKKAKKDDNDAENGDAAPKKARGRPKKTKDEETPENDVAAPPAKRSRKAAAAAAAADDDTAKSGKKKSRGRPKKAE